MKRKSRIDDACLFCNAISETVLHVITCPAALPTQTWEVALQELRDWLIQHQTDPCIIASLISGLQLWRRCSPEGNSVASDDPLIQAESAIRWNGVMEGVLGLHWTDQQDFYFNTRNSK
jgi:hypothetical protein